MYKLFLTLALMASLIEVKTQNCFDAFDAMFENGGDTLSSSGFRYRESQFLEKLKDCDAPDFSGTTLLGEDIILSGLQGKVIVLNFWFIHCLPCLKEIPLLNELTEQYDADEVVFIGLARDNNKSLEAFFKRFMLFEYKIIPESHLIADEYKVVGWPQSMVIDKQGKVYKVWAGAGESPQILVNEINETIEECLLLE